MKVRRSFAETRSELIPLQLFFVSLNGELYCFLQVLSRTLENMIRLSNPPGSSCSVIHGDMNENETFT